MFFPMISLVSSCAKVHDFVFILNMLLVVIYIFIYYLFIFFLFIKYLFQTY